MELSLDDIAQTFGWQLTFAAFFFLMTNAGLGLMSREKKDTLALWLMGAGSEENWSTSFLDLFDSLFGERHLSVRCLVRSCVASLISVGLIWGIMIWTGTLERVVFGDLGFGNALMIGIAVNFVADYLSLLETRYILGRVPKLRRISAQAIILIVDLAITATIILLAIWLVQRSGLVVVESADWLSIGLAFSIYSAPFYSTFLTSIWTWVYIVSTSVIRTFARWRLAEWVDVEHRPTLIVSLILSAIVFLGSLGVGFVLEKNESGLSRLDMAVCTVGKGTICDRMQALTVDPETRFLLQVNACGGDGWNRCINRGAAAHGVDNLRAVELFNASCEAGNPLGCSNLGVMHQYGDGVAADPQRAAVLYQIGCDGGLHKSCSRLGFLHWYGEGVARDFSVALELLGLGCRGGEARACMFSGILYATGNGVAQDDQRAAILYSDACEMEEPLACQMLANAYESGTGVEQDRIRATELYLLACENEEAQSCWLAGLNFERGLGVDMDPERAAQLFGLACDGEDALGCDSLGDIYLSEGTTLDRNADIALDAYSRACLMDYQPACDKKDDLSVD